MSKRTRWLLLGTLAVLYVLTGIGGWRAHQRELDDLADAAVKRRTWTPDLEQNIAGGLVFRRPHVHIHWCLPVFPGVLLANSDYSAGMLAGEGGTKLLLYDGFRTPFICWVGRHWISRSEDIDNAIGKGVFGISC